MGLVLPIQLSKHDSGCNRNRTYPSLRCQVYSLAPIQTGLHIHVNILPLFEIDFRRGSLGSTRDSRSRDYERLYCEELSRQNNADPLRALLPLCEFVVSMLNTRLLLFYGIVKQGCSDSNQMRRFQRPPCPSRAQPYVHRLRDSNSA